MDNVTHALAGLLLAEATTTLAARRSTRPLAPAFRPAALIMGVVAAELPDADLVYARPILGLGKLGYMLHHRGHTHTIVFALLAALALWGLTLLFRKDLRAKTESRWLLATALLGTTLTHIALDFTNGYGVHPWWPVSNAWHYGDAIFIVEPWLWIASIPALLFLERSRVVRALLAVVLVAILALAWRVDMVGQGVAIAFTIAAAVALAVAYTMKSPDRRIAFALGAWLVVEGVFFAASASARAGLQRVVGGTYADAAISPVIGNPFCFNALVVERDGPVYRASSARLAPFPELWTAGACAPPQALGERGTHGSARPSTVAVRWGEAWSAPVAELQGLARENCEIAAALRFIRVPVWQRLPDGRVRMSDLRYGRGGGGFAEIVAPARPTTCPTWVPPWVPPRQAMLDDQVPVD